MMSEKTMVPKLMIAAVGRLTYVFLEGKCISEGVEDLKYSARDEKGNLCPTLDLKIDVKNFSFESGMSIEEFMKKVQNFRKCSSSPIRKRRNCWNQRKRFNLLLSGHQG